MSGVVFVYPGHRCSSFYVNLAWLKLEFANRDSWFLLGDEVSYENERDYQQNSPYYDRDILPKLYH